MSIFNVEELNKVNQIVKTQQPKTGFSRTKDAKFPIYGWDLDTNYVVYIPPTLVRKQSDGTEVFEPVEMLGHNVMDSQFGTIHRCIHGLEQDIFKERLGYTGECPMCTAMKECWDLQHLKVAEIGKKKGVDPKNDPDKVLEADKSKLARERAVQDADSYVAFPIVIVPNKNNTASLADNALEGAKAYYVIWKKSQYEKRILSQMSNLPNRQHMAGLFMTWNYVYNSNGAKPSKMKAGLDAKYNVIPDQMAYQHLVSGLDKLAEEFTADKAYEVLVQYQFETLDSIKRNVDKVMTSTRTQLELLTSNGEGGDNSNVATTEAEAVLNDFTLKDEEDAVVEEAVAAAPKKVKTTKTGTAKAASTKVELPDDDTEDDTEDEEDMIDLD